MNDQRAADPIAGVIHRPRLYRLLDARSPQICVLQGPSGIGKTTLLRSWASALTQEQPPVVWIALSAGVPNRHAFWQQVAASARRHGDLPPDLARQVSEQLGVTVDAVKVAIGVLGDAGPITLVLDAYEHLADTARQIDSDLLRLTAAAPDLRIMIATRGTTTLADAANQVRGLAQVVTDRDLALTSEEVADLVALHLGRADARLAKAIMHATKGYALAVRAALLTAASPGEVPRPQADWRAAATRGLEASLPDTAAAQFVADTSVPPYFDEALATLITGHHDVPGVLDFLERNGFGRWIPYAAGRPVFQYVESIRDTFGSRAAADDPVRRQEICAHVAVWLFADEDFDQALWFAIDAGEHTLAERIFVHLLMTNPESYITDRYLEPLRRVPGTMLDEHPLLAFALGLALMSNPVLRSEAPRAFTRAIESTAAPDYLEPELDAFCLASVKAVCHRLVSDFDASAEASLKAMELATQIAPEVTEQFGDYIGTILRQLSYSLLQGGMIDEALAAMARSAALCTDQTARNYSLVYASGAHAVVGDVSKATAIAVTIDRGAWPEEFQQSYMNAMGLIAEGYARLDDFAFREALELLGQSESYIQTAEFWPFLTTIAMTARLGLGQSGAEAERITAELSRSTPPPGVGVNFATEQLHATLAALWLAAGEPARAQSVLEAQPDGSPHLAAVRLVALIDAGRHREAHDRAPHLLALPGHTIRSRAATQTAAAVAAARQGDDEQAVVLLHGAMVAYEAYGPRVHLLLLSDHDRHHLSRLAGDDDRRGYLRVPPSAASRRDTRASLTPRERAVLRAVMDHGATKEVAAALFVSPNTVKSQLRTIYRKLGVSSRQAAISIAVESGLLDDP